MKRMLIWCILSFARLSSAETPENSRGCIYIDGICESECEVGTHSYTTGCDYLEPEPTCDNPKPKVDTMDMICDFSACYCDPPTVREQVSGKCIPLAYCPKKINSSQ